MVREYLIFIFRQLWVQHVDIYWHYIDMKLCDPCGARDTRVTRHCLGMLGGAYGTRDLIQASFMQYMLQLHALRKYFWLSQLGVIMELAPQDVRHSANNKEQISLQNRRIILLKTLIINIKNKKCCHGPPMYHDSYWTWVRLSSYEMQATHRTESPIS